MNLSRFLRSLLTSALLAAPFAYAADPVVLHIGDQNYYNVRASVEASGVLEGALYTVDWKHFQAAAPLAEALNTGALDLGFLGDSGFLFLAAKQAPVKLIGVSRQNPDTIALLVPKDSPVKTIADLKGKKVAYWPGAWSQQLTLRALENADLPDDYVDFIKLMPIDAAAALPQGSIDAFPIWEPYISQQILFSGARPILTAKNLMPGLSAIAASTPSIDSKREAIADFLGRLKKAGPGSTTTPTNMPTSGRRKPTSIRTSHAIGCARHT